MLKDGDTADWNISRGSQPWHMAPWWLLALLWKARPVMLRSTVKGRARNPLHTRGLHTGPRTDTRQLTAV